MKVQIKVFVVVVVVVLSRHVGFLNREIKVWATC